jgi:hypothetical protein
LKNPWIGFSADRQASARRINLRQLPRHSPATTRFSRCGQAALLFIAS